jgi:hypothetical protein
MKAKSFLFLLAGALGLVFVLTASKCESTTEFPGYKPEICSDNIDNDEDRLTDCLDPDCKGSCAAIVTIDSIASPTSTDTIKVTGSQTNAISVTVSVTPSGVGGLATPHGGKWEGQGTWEVKLTQIINPGVYTVTAMAKDKGTGSSSATATFTRK